MKNVLLITFLALSPMLTLAQKNNLFADAGITGDGDIPGGSLTYSRKLFKYLGAGVGMQAYTYFYSPVASSSGRHFVPAVYGDLRAYIPAGKSLFFGIADMGIDIYTGEDATNNPIAHQNGLYTGFGIGYCYRITRRGMGPYISIKFVSDTYKTKQYIRGTNDVEDATIANGTSVVSLGFKF
jgi:hypothetical protein